MAESEQDVLLDRLARYPVDRYPVQHATTQFHLGSVLLQAGETAQALQSLTVARDVFSATAMRFERAKAAVMLGAALRAAGQPEQAAAEFTTACADLATLDQPAEQAAASYNLGLVHQEAGDVTGAHLAWSGARELFLAAGHPAQAAAAARDHGASLLASGDVEAALPLLQQAVSLAERAGDERGAGSAANALGLAHLAAGDPSAAVSALRRAVGSFPRSLRPAEHAMVKANLALAYERVGDRQRARLAAGQALAVSSAARPVRAQAREVLARLPGRADEDLLAVLDREEREEWGQLLRDEMLRVTELPESERDAMLRGYLDGVLARPGLSYDLVHGFLEVVLELPPRTYQLLVSAVSAGCAGRPPHEAERLRCVIDSAMARFALPQWQRLAASLNAAAEGSGEPATWR